MLSNWISRIDILFHFLAKISKIKPKLKLYIIYNLDEMRCECLV
jgi:hypothetical protein